MSQSATSEIIIPGGYGKVRGSVTLDEMPEPLDVYTILVSGGLGAGKTTLVDNLFPQLSCRLVDGDVHVMIGHFATILKEDCARIAKVDSQIFYTQEGKQQFLPSVNMTAGRLLQEHGEGKRQEDPQHWVKLLKKQIDEETRAARKTKVIVIVGDCRHPNEIDNMRPGFAVRLNGDPRGVRARSNRDLNHPSETALNDYKNFDVVINTDTTGEQATALIVLNELYEADKTRFAKLNGPLYLE